MGTVVEFPQLPVECWECPKCGFDGVRIHPNGDCICRECGTLAPATVVFTEPSNENP
jgi:hypothetical protein